MDSLSSCYFCGIALDEPLETYLLGTGEAEASVTLCPTCHRKLETVLDTVAVGDDALSEGERSDPGLEVGGPATGQSTGPETSEDSDAGPIQSGADASDILVDPEPDEPLDADTESGSSGSTSSQEPTTDDQPAPDDPPAGASSTERASPEASTEGDDATPPEKAGDDGTADDETGTAGATADGTDGNETGDEEVKAVIEDQEDEGGIEAGDAGGESLDREDDATAGHGEDETERIERDDETASASGEETIERGEAQDETAIEGREAETESEDKEAEMESEDRETEMESGDGKAEMESRGGGTASEGEESGADDAGESQTDRTVRTSISALEYNKVMRLLQNREFPVDREEIEIVASNAYDLSRSDCTKVIDLAIDRGLLDEDGGQLERPEQ
jgi:hypothetical protein